MRKTRAERAAALIDLLKTGPASLTDPGNERINDSYRLWVSSWVLPEVRALVPELKGGGNDGP